MSCDSNGDNVMPEVIVGNQHWYVNQRRLNATGIVAVGHIPHFTKHISGFIIDLVLFVLML